ncbi:MAG: YlxM family DNA-binding protein [Clostridiales Family XIII bacterium]|jgi:predicted DNA-binding protein YlxM (UPF0122 family)|nr:YlxM family DNA-binding protein [Clostridiales Family XIII bacterium]
MARLEDMMRMSMLYDFYGTLLNGKQRDIFRLYHGDNLSLSEISAELGITRQGVHDTLKKAEAALGGFEEKLGLIEKFRSQNEQMELMRTELDAIHKANAEIGARLEAFAGVIGGLTQ